MVPLEQRPASSAPVATAQAWHDSNVTEVGTKKKSLARDEFEAARAAIPEQLATGKRFRRTFANGGHVSLDRLLPFLVLYRQPSSRPDPGTSELANVAAAHLIAPDDKRSHRDLVDLVSTIRNVSMENFGAFLLVEIWSRPPEHRPIADKEDGPRSPGFRLFATPENAQSDAVLNVLQDRLAKIKSTQRLATVEIADEPTEFGKRPRPLLGKHPEDTLQIGIEVEPSYRGADGQTVFPGVLRTLRRGLDNALRRAFFHYARRETKQRPKNFHSLGRRALVKTVWDVDSKLESVSSSFDFLLSVTPINIDALWRGFRSSDFERLPTMRYRPLPIDPAKTKRALYTIPIESIEDPTILDLFSEKQQELDRQLTMLKDRGSERFLLGGLQLYGRVSPTLLRAAEELLERVPATARPKPGGRPLQPHEFVAVAEAEIAHYRRQWEGVEAEVRLTKNLLAGLMVSGGNLLVASDSKTPQQRADALVQHEIGTHLVTYYNGKAQRLSQLRSGLAGYEELQEGLAVLAEFLVSGMTPGRLRVLAARVIACRAILDGGTFVDTFRLLCRFGFQSRAAFDITLRVYRGGGLVKDCVYLRGLLSLLDYLAQGEPVEKLFVGKIALNHVPIMAELESRGVVTAPKLLPRYLERPDSQERLAALREGRSLYQLLAHHSHEPDAI